MALKDNIKKYRKISKLTQKELAIQSGLSYSMVSKLESGEQSNPTTDTLNKIASVLNVNPSHLLSDGSIRIIPREQKPIEEMTPEERELYFDELEQLPQKTKAVMASLLKTIMDAQQGLDPTIEVNKAAWTDFVLKIKPMLDAQPSSLQPSINALNRFGDMLIETTGESMLFNAYDSLNLTGKKEAVKRVTELTQIEEYTKPDETEDEDQDE